MNYDSTITKIIIKIYKAHKINNRVGTVAKIYMKILMDLKLKQNDVANITNYSY